MADREVPFGQGATGGDAVRWPLKLLISVMAVTLLALTGALVRAVRVESGRFAEIQHDWGILGLLTTQTGLSAQLLYLGVISLFLLIRRVYTPKERSEMRAQTLLVALTVLSYCLCVAAMRWLSKGGTFTMGAVGMMGVLWFAPTVLMLLLLLPLVIHRALSAMWRSPGRGHEVLRSRD